jgi:hypothetical protein
MKTVVRVVVIVLVIVGARYGWQQFQRSRENARLQSVEFLEGVVAEENERTPMRINENVELMSFGAEQGALIVNYRFLHYDGRNMLTTAWQAEARKNACENASVREDILGRGIHLKLNIHDKHGLQATTLRVAPHSCSVP